MELAGTMGLTEFGLAAERKPCCAVEGACRSKKIPVDISCRHAHTQRTVKLRSSPPIAKTNRPR